MATLQEPFTALPEDRRTPSRQSRTTHHSTRSISGTPETRQSSSRDSKSSQPSHRSGLKQPSYEESALRITSSPPLTSFLNDRHSASSAQEEAYLKHSSRLRVARTLLSVLTIATSASAVGVTAHILKFYNDTRLGTRWHLPLWPIDIDIKPTLSILIPAAIALFSSLTYILIALIPSPRSRTTLLTPLYLLSTLTTALVSVFALIHSTIHTYHTDPTSHSSSTQPRDTIHSFTCRLYHSAHTFNTKSADLGIPMFGSGVSYPAGFKRLCVESEVGMGLIGGCVVLGLLGVGVGLFGWRGDKKIERGRRERWGEKYADGKGLGLHGTGAYPRGGE